MNSFHVLALMSLALIAGAAAADDHKATLEKLCRLEKDTAEVTRQSDVRSLIELLKSDSGVECPAGVRDAILALEPLIELPNVCSQEAANTIVAFWQLYGSKKSKVKKNLPKQLRKFFLGFGLQASKECKKAMISELEKANQEYGITAEDINIAAEPVQANVAKIFGSDSRIENLLVIVKADKADSQEATIKVDMAPKQRKYFELLRDRCVHKFKPIYDTLIGPVVRLAAIGVSYNGRSIAADLAAFEQSQLFKDWFAIVLACEASARYTPVEVPKEKVDAEGNTQLITFLDEEDLDELKQRTGLSFEEPAIVEPVDYQVAPVTVGDLVVDEADADLTKAIAKHRYTLSSVNKFRLRLLRRLPALMKSYMDQRAVKFGLLSSEAKTDVTKRGKFGSAGNTFVRVMKHIGSGLEKGITFVFLALNLVAGLIMLLFGALFVGIFQFFTLVKKLFGHSSSDKALRQLMDQTKGLRYD